MRRWARLLPAMIAVAAIVHVATLWALPRLIMARAIDGLDAAGALNAAIHPPRPDDTARSIVLPSPDLLYTACRFDLDAGALRISAPVPPTYWSVAFFADNTDNFFVLDDRTAGGSRVDITLMAPGRREEAPPGTRIVEAPSRRGIVLFRTLIVSEDALPALRAAQQAQDCAPARSQPAR
jgi:uncharacterized membrane protein